MSRIRDFCVRHRVGIGYVASVGLVLLLIWEFTGCCRNLWRLAHPMHWYDCVMSPLLLMIGNVVIKSALPALAGMWDYRRRPKQGNA